MVESVLKRVNVVCRLRVGTESEFEVVEKKSVSI